MKEEYPESRVAFIGEIKGNGKPGVKSTVHPNVALNKWLLAVEPVIMQVNDAISQLPLDFTIYDVLINHNL